MRRILLLIVAICLVAGGVWRQHGGNPAGAIGQIFPPSNGARSGTVSAARKTWGNPASLADHFARHGADFGARDAEDYARMAWEFGERARGGGLLVKVDDEGVRRVFDPRTNAFGAYNADGTTRTFFKPNHRDYFNRQPGRAP